MWRRFREVASCFALASCGIAYAQTCDDDQIDERLDPGFAAEQPADAPLQTLTTHNYQKYPFLRIKSNHIALNGADWTGLQQMLAACGDTVISIVHIGDSHIQAEGATTRTRSLLHRRYGSAGRGLISPLKLVGTNQPFDYEISTTSDFEKAWIMRSPWPIAMGFTGAAIRARSSEYSIKLCVKRRAGGEPDFDFVRMYGSGSVPRLTSVQGDDGHDMMFSEYVSGDTMSIFLYEPSESVTLKFRNAGSYCIYGFQLENQMTGVLYSAIGNNGATYSRYNEYGSMGRDLQSMSPHLVIVSLGTNEAFGQVTSDEFYNQIHHFVTDIREHNPHAQVLLVTPQECQKATYVRSGKGKRRKRVKSYSVNTNIRRLRDVILRYGTDHSVATYDWYDVAGGSGSSATWLRKGLMKRDRIHNTWTGYELQGSLFYDALIEAADKPLSIDTENNTEQSN